MNRTTACYKLKYGLSKTLKERMAKVLQNCCFSLNIDESTSNAEDSILAILMQFFSEEENRVIIQHLASVKLENSTAKDIYSSVVAVIESQDIPWSHLISVLMDSCNTMRGKKTGVEVRLRTNKAPHLLDVDGDTCHTANNCAKKFTAFFGKHLENLFDDIYYDLKSASKREIFFKLCSTLGIKKLKPLKRPEHRWLYLLTVLQRVKEIWDVLIVFYYSYVNKDDKDIYASDHQSVLESRNLSVSQRNTIDELSSHLRSRKLTKEAESRKKRIINGLFAVQKKTLLHMALFSVVLVEFEKFVKLFQMKKPMIHRLHTSIYELVANFLGFFIKPEVLTKCKSYKDLLKLDVCKPETHVPNSLLYIGSEASSLCKKMGNSHPCSKEFVAIVSRAYISTAKYMLEKMPLSNNTLICFSALDPELRGKTSTLLAYEKLASYLAHLFSECEKNDLDLETRLYQRDLCITEEFMFSLDSAQNKVPVSLDEYWCKVFNIRDSSTNRQKYPILSKLVKACLSCFHGPSVESAFNLMDMILTDGRTSLKVDTLDAVQTVKYDLLSSKSTTCQKYGTDNPVTTPLSRDLVSNVVGSWNAYRQEAQTASFAVSSSPQSSSFLPSCSFSSVQNTAVVNSSPSKKPKGNSKFVSAAKTATSSVDLLTSCSFSAGVSCATARSVAGKTSKTMPESLSACKAIPTSVQDPSVLPSCSSSETKTKPESTSSRKCEFETGTVKKKQRTLMSFFK